MQLKLFRWTLLFIFTLATFVGSSILGFGTKKSNKAPLKGKIPDKKAPLHKSLQADYINGLLSIHGSMLFNPSNKPSSLKLFLGARFLKFPQDTLEGFGK